MFRKFFANPALRGVSGLVPCGSTGEAATLSPEEYALVIKTVVAEVKGRVPVMPGVGTNSTARSVEMVKKVTALGADALLAQLSGHAPAPAGQQRQPERDQGEEEQLGRGAAASPQDRTGKDDTQRLRGDRADLHLDDAPVLVARHLLELGAGRDQELAVLGHRGGTCEVGMWRPQQESNLHLALRRRSFYPLNYGGGEPGL